MNVIYEVAAIVGRRVKRGKVEYRVRWKGFPPEEDTWEPSYSLRESCFQLIRMYNAEHRMKREIDQSVPMTGCSRSPSPSLNAETSPSKKTSPSVCSSDQLSLVSAVNCSPRSASPQSISPPIATTRPISPSKPPAQHVKRTESPRPQTPVQRPANVTKMVKRTPNKASSTGSSTPTSGGRKKVTVVFNSMTCDSPPPSEAKCGDKQKRECLPLEKAATDSPNALIQRESVKTVDITSSDRQYRDYPNHGTGLSYHSSLKDKRGNAQMSNFSVESVAFTEPAPLKHRKVFSNRDSPEMMTSSADGALGIRKKRKYERKRPYKRKNLNPDGSKINKAISKLAENQTTENDEGNHVKLNNEKRRTMKSGKKTQEYIKLKSKSLRKVDRNKSPPAIAGSGYKTPKKRVKAFRRIFEPPHHAKQLSMAMDGNDGRSLPVMVVYALDRIKKMKRKSDVENIHDVMSRMETNLYDKKMLVDNTVTSMEKEGQLLRWEGSGSCSYRVSYKAIQMLGIDNSDGYLYISGDKKNKLKNSSISDKFEKPKLNKYEVKKVSKNNEKYTRKEESEVIEKELKKMPSVKKDGYPGRKRKFKGEIGSISSCTTGKDVMDPILPLPSAKRRKMLEESSEVSASSSSGPPTDSSYQAKETKNTTASTHSTASSSVSGSSQTLVNKACNIIENIQKKSKPNTHIYVVGKHVILTPPSDNGTDTPIAKQISNLPHKRFGANGGGNGSGANGNGVHSENGSNGSPVLTFERRISVRQTESALRYKEIVVKRQDNFVEIALQSTIGLMKNVFTMTTLQELTAALQTTVQDYESRLVVIRGTDFVFSHGVDISYIVNRRGSDSTLVRFAETLRQFLLTLVNFPKPVIAVLNGPAIGLGAALLPLCDIVYASDKAFIQLPYCFLGQTPEGGSSFTFPKVVGGALATDMFMSGRKLTAKEASDRGLISDVFWPSVLMPQTVARCRRIAQCPPKSLESTKCIIRSQQRDSLIYAIESECSMLAECWESSEFKQKSQEYLNSTFESM